MAAAAAAAAAAVLAYGMHALQVPRAEAAVRLSIATGNQPTHVRLWLLLLLLMMLCFRLVLMHCRFPELKQLCIYHRHQRAFTGPPVSSSIPTDLALAKRMRLLDCFEAPAQQLLVVFAGSYS
jgi:hypothetical protein